MRFPHNAKIFRGQFDAAPFVSVFFLLLIFLIAHTSLVVVPGVPIELPVAANLPGTDKPVAVVAVDEGGAFYFENQLCDEDRLRERLKAAMARSPEPLTLVVRVHRAARAEVFTQLAIIARDAGIREMIPEVRLAPSVP
jgi:biopolymer transport protein ExbD